MENTNTSFFARNKVLLIVLVVIVLLLSWAVGIYNSFARQNVAIDAQWAQVENQLQRRFDLIPNLVNSVKGATAQEQKVFGDIADARTRYGGATTVDQKAAAASSFDSALGRLLVISEQYPELKSIQAFRDLMVSIEGSENRLSVERGKYNDYVKGFNTSVQVFPGSLFASMFGFHARTYFEVANEAKNTPVVNFTN